MAQQIAADSAGDVGKVGDFAAIGELSTGNEPLEDAGHEHEGPRLAICRAAEGDAAVARLHLEQPPLTLFEIGVVEAIHSDNVRARVPPVAGQCQRGQNLALGVASEAERLDDRPDVGCRGDVKIRGLLVSECTFEKLRGVTSKAGLYIPAREIGEQLLAITDTAQARDQEDNADRIAIRFEHIAVPRHIWRHGPRSQAPEPASQ